MPASLLSWACNCGAIVGVVLLVGSGRLAWREWESLSGADPRWGARAEAAPAIAGEVVAMYEGVFHATVYYTPLESGFAGEAGFDMTPTTKPGLAGKKFPRDFLKTVKLEGFGRMDSPVDGKYYVRCSQGRWDYSAAPLDRGGQPLQALRSTAVGVSHTMIQPNAHFRVQAEGLPTPFMDARWMVCDTGSGLGPRQIDFYWGEDAPLGPGRQLSRPRGMPQPITSPTILVLR